MGYWGYGAYENDAAGDWVCKALVPRLRSALRLSDTDEALAAVGVIADLELVPWFDKSTLDKVFDRVEKSDLTARWEDASARQKYLRQLRRRIARGQRRASWSPGLLLAAVAPWESKQAKKPREE